MEATKKIWSGKTMLLAGTVIALLAGAGWWWHFAHPNFSKYADAIEAMRQHHVRVDDVGKIDFSSQFPGLTADDSGQITWLDDGSFRAVFPTYRERDATLVGLMYTSRPLTDDDTDNRVSGIRFNQRTIRVGSYGTLLLDEKLNDNWYKVSYRVR